MPNMPKALYNCIGESLLNHHQCAASTWMMPAATVQWPHTSCMWRGEREIESIQLMWIYNVYFFSELFDKWK